MLEANLCYRHDTLCQVINRHPFLLPSTQLQFYDIERLLPISKLDHG